MFCKPAGRVIEIRSVQLLNAALPMVFNFVQLLKLISSRLEQYANAHMSMVVKLAGKVIEVRLVQFQNALLPMVCKFAGRSIEVSLEQPPNALVPMFCKPAGRVIVSRLVQS